MRTTIDGAGRVVVPKPLRQAIACRPAPRSRSGPPTGGSRWSRHRWRFDSSAGVISWSPSRSDRFLRCPHHSWSAPLRPCGPAVSDAHAGRGEAVPSRHELPRGGGLFVARAPPSHSRGARPARQAPGRYGHGRTGPDRDLLGLTRLPPPYRLRPGDALAAMEGSWSRVEVVTLAATEIWPLLRALPDPGSPEGALTVRWSPPARGGRRST